MTVKHSKRKHVILVAGTDNSYRDHPKHIPQVPFYDFCTNRIKQLLEYDPMLTFTLFDVNSGSVRQTRLNNEGRRIAGPVPSLDFEAITDAHYYDEYDEKGRKHHLFFQLKKNKVMSIVDIYKFIQRIGGQEETAGFIIELSIFSHSEEKGPVLVNTFQNKVEEEGKIIDYAMVKKRDPTDKDGRLKDFESENMSEIELKHFRRAFHADGIVWLWGCQFDTGYGRVMSQILNHPKYSANATQNKFASKFDMYFNFSPEDALATYTSDSFFPWTIKGKRILRFHKTGKEIIQFFRKAHEETYCSVISNILHRKCYGAFIGTYSEDENHMRKKPKYPLMRVPRGEFDNPNVAYKRYINFFTNVLNYKQAPGDRGYGTYEPFSVAEWISTLSLPG